MVKTTAAARTSRPSGRSSRRSTARKSAKATRAFSRISTPMSSTPRATSAALIPRRWRRSISSKSAATALRWRRIRSFPTWRRRTASAGRALCRRILKFTRPTRPRPSASRILLTTSRVARTLGVKPEECLMVGNDATEDMAAREVGMDVFLLTDCLINAKKPRPERPIPAAILPR